MLRDELLAREAFDTLLEAKVLIERWRQHYNTVRPHSALGHRPPAPEARQPCAVASATAQGWSVGGQKPNLETGVIHGGRSHVVRAEDWAAVTGVAENPAPIPAPSAAVSGHQEPSTLHEAREKTLDVQKTLENQYPRQGYEDLCFVYENWVFFESTSGNPHGLESAPYFFGM